MYMFILISSRWHCQEVDNIRYISPNAQEIIENGDIVAFADDKDYFAEQMKINVEDIEEVE